MMDTLEYLLLMSTNSSCARCGGRGYVYTPVYGLGGEPVPGIENPTLCPCKIDGQRHVIELRVTLPEREQGGAKAT